MGLSGAGILGFGAAPKDDAGVGGSGVSDGDAGRFVSSGGGVVGQVGQPCGREHHSAARLCGGPTGDGPGAPAGERVVVGGNARRRPSHETGGPGHHDGRVAGAAARGGLVFHKKSESQVTWSIGDGLVQKGISKIDFIALMSVDTAR